MSLADCYRGGVADRGLGECMHIRAIEAKDDAVIRDIIRAGLKEHGLDVPGTAYFDPQLDSLSSFYAEDGRAYVVVCDDGGRVIGGAGYAEVPGSDGKIAELQKLYVSSDGRGSGASYQLIAQVETGARADGYSVLYLETHHRLQAAMHVYERTGFSLIDGPLGDAQHTTMDRFYRKSLVSEA